MSLKGALKIALLVFVVWYVRRNPTGAATTARGLWDWAFNQLSVAARAGAAFLDGLGR